MCFYDVIRPKTQYFSNFQSEVYLKGIVSFYTPVLDSSKNIKRGSRNTDSKFPYISYFNTKFKFKMRKKHICPFFDLRENGNMKLNKNGQGYKTQNPKHN